MWWLCSCYAQELFKMGSQFPSVLLAAAEWAVGNIKEFSCNIKELPCREASAFSWEGSQESWRQVAARLLFIFLLSPGQPCTVSFKDSRNGQRRTSLPLSHCQRRRRVEPALLVKSRKLSEVIFNSLISNKSKSLVFCLSCSNRRCTLPCRTWYGRVLEKPRLVFGAACSELSPVTLPSLQLISIAQRSTGCTARVREKPLGLERAFGCGAVCKDGRHLQVMLIHLPLRIGRQERAQSIGIEQP